MIKAVCMFCKKEHSIEPSDSQYNKIKMKQSKSFVCTNCNKSLKQEAMKNTDFDPTIVDPYKFDKLVP